MYIKDACNSVTSIQNMLYSPSSSRGNEEIIIQSIWLYCLEQSKFAIIEQLLLCGVYRKSIYDFFRKDGNARQNIIKYIIDTPPHLQRIFLYYAFAEMSDTTITIFIQQFMNYYCNNYRKYMPVLDAVYWKAKEHNVWPESAKKWEGTIRGNISWRSWGLLFWIIIARRRVREFLHVYYSPPYGKGYLRLHNNWVVQEKLRMREYPEN